MHLCTYSAWHSQWTVGHVLDWLLPPIELGQYVLVREVSRPVAYASWAFVDDAAQEVLRTDSRALMRHEWRSGTNIWVMDLIAPFGHVRQVVRMLRQLAVENGLADLPVRWKRRYVVKKAEV